MTIKPAQNTHIYLIGPRGSGKSLLGRELGQAVGLPFYDLDVCIAEAHGQSIAEMVAAHGWAVFRAREQTALKRLAVAPEQSIIATGGGVVLDADNCKLMREQGTVIYLEAPLAVLLARVMAQTADHRPALTELPLAEEMAQVTAERAPLYERAAHYRINAGRDMAEVLTEILQRTGMPHG